MKTLVTLCLVLFASTLFAADVIVLVLLVGLFGVLAFGCASCAHRRLPADFPVGPDIAEWFEQHSQTEFPKLTDP